MLYGGGGVGGFGDGVEIGTTGDAVRLKVRTRCDLRRVENSRFLAGMCIVIRMFIVCW
jgi:hypothetical protein